MKLEGLSLQQAPPISVPFRFFLTAPLFGILSATLMIWLGEESLTSRWTPGMLAITHGILLGFLTSIMFGAQMQMLPVLAGATIDKPQQLGWFVHTSWTIGVLALLAAFITGKTMLFQTALLMLGGAVIIFSIFSGLALSRATSKIPSIPGMKLSLISLLVTVGWGVFLGLGHTEHLPLQRPASTDIHAMWGLLGWVSLLIMSVAYQVVPLFQITDPYPKLLTRLLAPAVFWLLILRMAISFFEQGQTFSQQPIAAYTPYCLTLIDLLISAALALFATATLKLQYHRRRSIKDSHQQYWRIACIGLLATIICWWAARIINSPETENTAKLFCAVLYVTAFVMPVAIGMLYKISAFLLWFHLQGFNTQRIMAGKTALDVPHMKALIPEKRIKIQLYILITALLLTILLTVSPAWLCIPAGIAWLANFSIMAINLSRAYLSYYRLSKTE